MGPGSIFNFIDYQKREIEFERKRIDDLKKNIRLLYILDDKDDDKSENNENNNDVDKDNEIIRKDKTPVLGRLEPLQRKCKIDEQLHSLNDKLSPSSKFFGFEDEPISDLQFITPRSRLLATETSRIKAEQYRKELMKQIEDKKKRQAEELRQRKIEEMELERKIEEQRRKMMEEYILEQRRLRRLTDEVLKKQEIDKLVSAPINELLIPRCSASRSPSYMHLRSPRLKKKKDKCVQSLINNEAFKKTEPKLMTRFVMPINKRIDENISSENEESEFSVCGKSINKYEKGERQQEREENGNDDDDDDNDNDNEQEENEDNIENREQKKNDKSKNDRVLAHLSEIRQKVQQDHLNMLKIKYKTDNE